MAYEALARKWRPRTFEEIVGQGHVSRALANAIASGKIHHAYLFSGTRGVGKTTFARILARALNCEKGPTPTPCLSCTACEEIGAGSGADVQEIDGASNTGIDDIRRLRENAAYAPSRLRYKIYIIDEVHMLSKAAFNGLLKTLEEPPPHVVFIMATTEPNRIPDTILSRCQRFDFRMLTDVEVRGRLEEMARAEGVAVEEDALSLMARYAFGSMRDGQSLFEQAAVSGAGSVTSALVEGMLGLVGTEAAIDLVTAAVAEGAGPALTRFEALRSRGADLKFLYLSLIDVLRDATVLSFTGKEELLFRYSPTAIARVRELAARREREEWMFLLDVAFRSERDVLGTEFPHLGFELLLLRLSNAQGLLSLAAFEAGESPAPAARPFPQPAPSAPQASPSTFSTRAPDPKPATRGGDAAASGLWDALKRSVEGKKGKGVILMGLLNQMEGELREGEFVISCSNEMFLDRLKEPDKWSLLLSSLEEAAGGAVPVRLAASAEKKSPETAVAGPSEEELERKALSDPVVLEALRVFEGAMVVKVQPAPAGRPVPGAGERSGEAAADEPLADEEEK